LNSLPQPIRQAPPPPPKKEKKAKAPAAEGGVVAAVTGAVEGAASTVVEVVGSAVGTLTAASTPTSTPVDGQEKGKKEKKEKKDKPAKPAPPPETGPMPSMIDMRVGKVIDGTYLFSCSQSHSLLQSKSIRMRRVCMSNKSILGKQNPEQSALGWSNTCQRMKYGDQPSLLL
jgi:hypothetical protein